VELCGTVEGFYRAPNGLIAGVMLRVHVEEPALIPVLAKDLPRVAKGQKLFIRGWLATERLPGEKWPLLGVMARTIEVLRSGAAPARPEGPDALYHLLQP
jgi:hypothetical protein